MDFDVAVVGAGPAGLFAAVGAAERGARVLVLERMPSPGRKLLVSGSGQCNLTHAGSVAAFLARYGQAGKFLRPALYGLPNDALSRFFSERGVPLEETENGKLFPASRRARDVLDALLRELDRLGADVRTGARVLSAARTASGLEVRSEQDRFEATALIVATGGRSFPKTGSSGDGYAIAAGFGHRIVETAPALTPVEAAPAIFSFFVSCAGIALRDASVSVFRSGRKTAAGRGDVLFTHRGLSGPGILDLSRSLMVGDELRVPLAPSAPPREEVEARLLAETASHGKRTAARVLRDFGLADGLARALLAAVGVAEDLQAAALRKDARRSLALALSGGGEGGMRFPVAALGGFDEAMATRGGVDLSEVDPKRMESRLVPGLFFAGEVLDVDGDTGGYNIQAACSTGYLAGRNAADRKS